MAKIKLPPDETFYQFRVSKALWERAQAKAENNKPPLHMRYVLETLVEKWVNSAANGGRVELAERKSIPAPPKKAAAKPQKLAQVSSGPGGLSGLVDIGSSF